MICAYHRMPDVPSDWKPRMRELTDGGWEGSMWRWTYHDGSTWCAVLFDGDEMRPSAIVGWACWTEQEEPYPVLGVYIDPVHRGRGYARTLVSYLLTMLTPQAVAGRVYAVAERWPPYRDLIEAHGLTHVEWV